MKTMPGPSLNQIPGRIVHVSYGRIQPSINAVQVYLAAKQRLGSFIADQVKKGHFVRECPNPADLGRVILKLARKHAMREHLRPHAAILDVGCDVLGFYTADKFRRQVQKQFSNTVPDLSLSF